MRRVVATGFAVSFALMFSLALAGSAGADPIISGGQARIQINVLDPLVLQQSPASVTATSASVSTVDNLVQTVQFGGGIFQTAGLSVPVTDPASFPIVGVQATASNAAANFSRGFANAGKLGGIMPLNGVNKVCLYGSGGCSYASANISVPVNVVGQGGAAFVSVTGMGNPAPVAVTVLGAPWTTQTVAIGSVTRMATGNTAMTQNGGATVTNNIQLVTPIFVSTNIPASAVVPGSLPGAKPLENPPSGCCCSRSQARARSTSELVWAWAGKTIMTINVSETRRRKNRYMRRRSLMQGVDLAWNQQAFLDGWSGRLQRVSHRRHLLSAEGLSAREQGRVSWLAHRRVQLPPGLQLRDSAGLPLRDHRLPHRRPAHPGAEPPRLT